MPGYDSTSGNLSDLDDTVPPFVISPSQIGAAFKTAASLITFGVMFTGAIVGFARNLDLQGALIFLQRDDVTAWISAVLTGLYLIWRSRRAWVKKFREVLLVEHVPDNLAVLSTDLHNPDLSFRSAIANWLDPTRIDRAEPVSPSSRARETTTQPAPRMVLVGIDGGRSASGAPYSRSDTVTNGYRMVEGVGFGLRSDLKKWYGPDSIPRGTETATNGAFAVTNEGLLYEPNPNRPGHGTVKAETWEGDVAMPATSEIAENGLHFAAGIEPTPTVEEALPEIPIIDLRTADPINPPVRRDDTPVIS